MGRLASQVLRPGGVLLAYPSKVELLEVMNILAGHLRCHWMMSASHAEPTALPKLRLLSKWQPILVYVKGSFNPPMLVLDVPPIPKGKEKDRHPWQRPLDEFTYYTQQLTRPGEWILDFAAGSFASGRAAKNLGRNYIGIDIDRAAVAKGREWLEE